MQEASSFSDELWAEIRKDFGDHLMRHQEFKKARENFEESLQLQSDKLDSVYRLAHSLAREAKVTEALEILKSRSTQDNYENHFKCNLQECDCHYERCAFEQNILCLNEKMAKFKNEPIVSPHCGPLTLQKLENAKILGPKLSTLNQRFQRTIANYDDTLGKNAGECLWNLRKHIEKALNKSGDAIDFTPKVLKGSDPCLLVREEKEEKRVDIVQNYRSEKIKTKFAQSYMESSWKAYTFLNALKTNPILLNSTQNKKSFENINRALDNCIASTSALIEQLHARCPLYTKDHLMYRSEKQRMEICEIRSYRSRRRLCREIYTAIAKMARCRSEGKLENLIKVAENELSMRFRVNSNRLIPNKNEFIAKVCYIIAMAHIDMLLKPSLPARAETPLRQKRNSSLVDDYAQLGKLFGLKTKSTKTLTNYVFGDQSTYRDPLDSEIDQSFIIFKQKIAHLKDRLAQTPMLAIEKCHIYYEMGRMNLAQSLNDDAKYYGGLIVKEAGNAIHIWSFLGNLLIVRAEIMQKKFSRLVESLEVLSRKSEELRIDGFKSILLQAIEINNKLMKMNN